MSAIYGIRQPDQAAVSLLEGIAVNSAQPTLLPALTQLYRMTAPESCALNQGTVNLNCPMVHEQLCTASRNMVEMYTEMRDRASAAAMAQTAARNYGCSK